MQRKQRFTLIMIIVLTLTTVLQTGLFDTRQVLAAAGVGNVGEEPARLQQIEAILSQSSIGVNALSLMRQYDVKVRFAEGSGTAFRALPNTVIIDLRHEPLRAALAFVHEMNHARVWNEGLQASAHEQSREAYVMEKMQEEAESVALSLEARMELAQAGVDVSAVHYPLEHEYGAALHSVSSNVPGMSEEDVAEFGQRAGRNLVFDALMSGEVRGSSSGRPYTEKFGRQWDRVDALPDFLNVVWRVLPQDI